MESQKEMVVKRAGAIFKEVMAEYFPTLMNDINPQVREAL